MQVPALTKIATSKEDRQPSQNSPKNSANRSNNFPDVNSDPGVGMTSDGQITPLKSSPSLIVPQKRFFDPNFAEYSGSDAFPC